MTTQDSRSDTTQIHDDTSYDGDGPTGRYEGGEGQDGAVLDDGPTLLPVDAESDAAADSAYEPVDDPVARDEALAATPATPGSTAAPVADQSDLTTPAPAETGAVTADGLTSTSDTDPAVDTTAPDAVAGPAVVTPSAGAAAGTSGPGAEEWHELQSHFVDDPADAVRQAGQLVEQALADLRTRLESGDTEDLRTTFRRYRDLHASLT
jgi:hypothetical protein